MRKLIYCVTLLLLISCNPVQENDTLIKELEAKVKTSLSVFSEVRTAELVSPRSVEDNAIKMVKAKDWTSGFFPGELWMMYQLTHDDFWKQKAIDYTLPLSGEQWNGKTHDMGFKIYNSYGKAWLLTQNSQYYEVLIQAAKTLATRFDPAVGCIRSWDHHSEIWDYPVIIDNMMNLELLFWAANETGNDMFRNIAITHAETTMSNHFRDDYSSYHVVDYNTETGEVQEKTTHQGYSAQSAWSRGQGWALYGYTMVYRETGDERFLKQAENIASYILNHPNLPEHKVPYWDFDAPNIPNAPYDASAGALIGSALYELSTFSNNGKQYVTVADKILQTLRGHFFSADPKSNFGFLLKHSTGSEPHNSEIDKPLIYADYYFVEMITRKINLTSN